jgi:FG-GAP-like repeat
VASTLTQVTPVSASVYTVTVTGITGNGTLGLNLLDNNSIHDLAGNPLVQGSGAVSFQSQTTVGSGATPVFIAVADFNGDGQPDLAIANANPNTVSVLLGNGTGTFQSPRTFATANHPYAVIAADVNGDGIPDLVTANYVSNSVSVLLGNGNGTFQAQATFAAGSRPIYVKAGDFNNDGRVDLAVADKGGNSLGVLLGNGNGTFQSLTAYAAGPQPIGLVVADVNNDGNADLVVANTGTNTVSVLLGNGNGTFQSQFTATAGPKSWSVTVADVNGDGKQDVVVANYGANDVSVLLGNGNGTFQSQQTFAGGSVPVLVGTADVNGDGKPDILVENYHDNTIGVLLGNGNGTFRAQTTLATGARPGYFWVSDINHDGRPDIIVANKQAGDLSILLNSDNGNFTGQVYTIGTPVISDPYVISINRASANPTNASTVRFTVTFSEAVTGVDSSDFQVATTGTVASTLVQVVPVSASVYTVTVSGITGGGTLGLNLVDNGSIHDLAGNPLTQQYASAAFTVGKTFAAGAQPRSVVLADVNGDGIPDATVVNFAGNTLSVLLGNGNGTFQAPQAFTTGSEPGAVQVADFNGDGKSDLVAVNVRDNSVSVLLGNGNGTFQAQQVFATGLYPQSVAVGDVTGDGTEDLVVANRFSNNVSVLLGNGNGTFQAQQTFTAGALPFFVAVATVKGDGNAEIAVANYGSNNTSVLLGNGNGTFQAQQTFAVGTKPNSVIFGDVNDDGVPDLAVANKGSNTVSVLLGNGNGTFQAQQTFATGAEPCWLELADVNGDGKPDLAVSNYGGNTAGVLLGNGNGTFQAQQTLATGGQPVALAFGDVNGDGRSDLVVANNASGTVSVFLNAGNGNFTGQVYTIATNDITDPYVVSINRASANPTNGATLQFTVTFSEPVTGVDSSDFQVVTTGTVASTLTQVTPVSASVYTFTVGGITGNGTLGLNLVDNNSIHDLAGNPLVQGSGAASFQSQTTVGSGATPVFIAVADFNGDGQPDLAIANANPNTVSVLLGNGTGTFQSPQTFATANHPYAVIAADVNGDGIPDLVAANYVSNSVSVLLGNGNGTFQAQANFAAGSRPIYVKAGDFNNDGRVDLAVADKGGNSLGVLLGNGNGTFQSLTAYAAGPQPIGLVVADVNNDGNADLVVANTGTNTVSVLLGNGNGTFQSQFTATAGPKSWSVTVADVNGDGKPDVVVANYGANDVSVLLGNGNGTFQSQQTFAGGSVPVLVGTADVNGDGKPDILVENYHDNTIGVLLGNGNGTFQAQTALATGARPGYFWVTDINDDGRPDIVVANKQAGDLSVLLNSDNGNFTGQVYTIESLTHFTVTGVPVNTTAGTPFVFTVTALDQSNNVSTNYAGTVDFTSSDSAAILPTNSTLAGGIGTFSATLVTAGTQTLMVTDSNNSNVVGRSAVVVSPAVASHFAVGNPGTATLGSGIVFTVMAEDKYNNVATAYAGTVQFTSSDSIATLPASSTLSNGSGTFGATFSTVGNQTLMANDPLNNISGVGQPINVVSTGIHFVFNVPSTATAGIPFPFVVTALDQFNNTATGFTGTVNLSTSDTRATLSMSTGTLTGGVGLFAVTLRTAGNQTITVSNTVLFITNTSSAIVVVHNAASHFAIASPLQPGGSTMPAAYPNNPAAPTSFASAGVPMTFTVSAMDPYGNVDPTYDGAVEFSSSDSLASLPSNGILTNGVGIFSATLGTPGSQTLTVTDTDGGDTGTSGPIVTRGLVVTSFTPTPSGFVVTFNQPFDPSSVLMYTTGTTPDDIILATAGSQVSVRGSVLIDPTDTSITFVKTDSITSAGTFNPANGLLAAGTYTVTLRSLTAGGNGFEDALGNPLDGTDSGGTANYTTTFTVKPTQVAVGVPDFARAFSNTDALFFSSSLTNSATFNLSYTNPSTQPSTGTAIVTFSTTAATLQANIQAALTSGGLATQVGVNSSANDTPNSVVIVTNDVSSGANVLVTFQSALAQSPSQLLSSTTPGLSIAPATINVANNIPGDGIPIALSSGLNVTSGSFMLQYNPSLLTILGVVPKVAGASFTLVSNDTVNGTVVLSLSSASPISSSASPITLGSLLATVPQSARASYGTTQLLHFSGEQLNGVAGPISVTNADGVQVAAFFGDATDTGGPLSLSDASAVFSVANAISNTMAQTIPGFAAFPVLDPAIIGDVSLQGAVSSTDAGAILQEVSGTARITIPYAPIGLPAAPSPAMELDVAASRASQTLIAAGKSAGSVANAPSPKQATALQAEAAPLSTVPAGQEQPIISEYTLSELVGNISSTSIPRTSQPQANLTQQNAWSQVYAPSADDLLETGLPWDEDRDSIVSVFASEGAKGKGWPLF